jgi:hypothetical protein
MNIALTIGSLLAFYGTLEVGTRILWTHETPEAHEGVVLRGKNREYMHQGVFYRTNSDGIRGVDVPPKQPGERRILLLGDSFVWGDGLIESDTISQQLQRRLDVARPGYRVINAGIPGYDTQDELRQLRRLAPVYEPDTVVLFFFTNDVVASTGNIADGGMSVSWKQNLKETLRMNSKFFAFIYYVYKDWITSYLPVPRILLAPDYFDLGEGKKGWVAFVNAFTEIREFCAARGIRLAFVMIPTLTN